MLLLLVLPLDATAQTPLQFVRGLVRDTAGRPIGGADVLLGDRRAATNAQGVFRVDSLRPGRYPITVRMVGYLPAISRVVVVGEEPTEIDYYLVPAPHVLPFLVAEGRRSGIYGWVRDSGHRPLAGARVQVAGSRGGESRTDSLGQFALPSTDRGPYLVRVTQPGYAERRVMVEIKRGESRELLVLLAPSMQTPTRIEEAAFRDLRKRLAWSRRRDRLTGDDLARHGSGGLCDIPRIRIEVGGLSGETILILNGLTVIRDFPAASLCAWRADQVELVEIGRSICGETTQSIAWLLGVWCGVGNRGGPRSIMGSEPLRTQQAGGSYVVIWEKR